MAVLIGFVLSTTCCGVVHAQLSASALFCVDVEAALSILPPTVSVISLTHDGTANDQSLGNTLWPCLVNDADGAVVTFSTLTGFSHQTLPLVARDVELTLTIDSADGGAGWSVTTGTDQTDVSAVVPDVVATVQAESTGPGSATFDLEVAFVTGSLATLVPGTYCVTVVGTITAN
ncbi:hypothetical protein [Pseudobythopirellula maris]|nr:hypothetical protein [Pseudobythopirellula maris]